MQFLERVGSLLNGGSGFSFVYLQYASLFR